MCSTTKIVFIRVGLPTLSSRAIDKYAHEATLAGDPRRRLSLCSFTDRAASRQAIQPPLRSLTQRSSPVLSDRPLLLSRVRVDRADLDSLPYNSMRGDHHDTLALAAATAARRGCHRRRQCVSLARFALAQWWSHFHSSCHCWMNISRSSSTNLLASYATVTLKPSAN